MSEAGDSVTRVHERGFVLIAALCLAILYIAFMELLLIDSSRALAEAQRFRSKIVAAVLAENGAELAAARMVERTARNAEGTTAEGAFSGRYTRTQQNFELTGEGTTSGVSPSSASVELRGAVNGTRVTIAFSQHSQ
jgi:hypothetical protein